MGLLHEFGTVTYNGVDFGTALEDVASSIDAKPVYDPSGRTVSYVQYVLTVEGVVQSDGGTDASLETLRRRLTRNGGELHYDARGYGTSFTVNKADGTGVRDVAFGPKPEILNWRPLGGGRAARVTWRCTVCIPECQGGVVRYERALMESTFKWSVQIDRAGYSRRTLSGRIRIPQSLAATARQLRDCADAYLEDVIPDCPSGFVRESRNHEVDESKCVLTWQVVDVELGPQRYPPGVIKASFSHDVASGDRGFRQWTATITAQYELEKGADRRQAWGHFYRQYKRRVLHAKEHARNDDGTRGAVLPVALRIREVDAYDRETSEFTLTYRFISTFKTFLFASGLWLPVDGSDDRKWRSSLAKSTFSPRGLARLKLSPADDVVINLCQQSDVFLGQGGLEARFPAFQGGIEVEIEGVTPQTSWMAYETGLDVSTDDGTVEHKPLANEVVELRPGGAAGIAVVGAAAGGAGGRSALPRGLTTGALAPLSNRLVPLGQLDNQEGIPPRFERATLAVVQNTPPSIYVTLWGKAVRAGYPITPPILERIGGVKATPANREGTEGVRSWVGFNAGGIPVVVCVWRLRYLLTETPTEPILPPANPLLA